jgi:lysozyme family protein
VDDAGIIAKILSYEGKFVNNPNDHGGATNFGITAAEYGRVKGLGRAATADEVRAMPQADAEAIYMRDYIQTPKFDGINDGNLRMVVVDCGVLHGTGRAARWLQQAAGTAVDGVIGAATLEKVNAGDPSALARAIIGLRITFLGALISRDRTQAVFAAGWMARVSNLLQYA